MTRKSSGEHHCHWPGCSTPVPPRLWGCRKHWLALPAELRAKIWDAYRPGQEITKTPSDEYITVAQEVRRWVLAHHGDETKAPRCIGIVGSRRRDSADDYRACLAAFDSVYRLGDQLVSGGCPQGADRFAEQIAKRRGLTIVIHYPDWNGDSGRAAGFERNALIAQDADLLIALVASDRTGGTEDTIRKAKRLGRGVLLVMPDGCLRTEPIEPKARHGELFGEPNEDEPNEDFDFGI